MLLTLHTVLHPCPDHLLIPWPVELLFHFLCYFEDSQKASLIMELFQDTLPYALWNDNLCMSGGSGSFLELQAQDLTLEKCLL